MTVRERIDEQANELRSLRDDLRVRVHLAKLEAQDMWEDLEREWERAEAKLKVLGEAGQEAAEDVAEAAEMVLSELKEGYDKLRRLI